MDAVDRDVTRVVDQILDSNHRCKLSLHDDRAPYEPCNVRGYAMRALPTLMATPNSHAFRTGRQGSLWNTESKSWEEQSAQERERAMGYETGTTAAPGVTETERRKVLGNAIDQRALSGLLSVYIVLPITRYKSSASAQACLRQQPRLLHGQGHEYWPASDRQHRLEPHPVLPELNTANRAVVSATALRRYGPCLQLEEEQLMQRFSDAETNADWYGRYSPQQEAAEEHSPPRQPNHNHAQVAACYRTSVQGRYATPLFL